ncbi:hypothetical protein BDA96_09G004100 [Sorghum bicolor]|uniref:Uncharacterized protein n=2 Tax=Sorghum bicolor TaxID=4558 RepID=A0A921U335_SORBI|nr:hypothetical protein BDA96_09G004100 [Sorghum bicolor]KXG21013.1 hypothetical protein SORBI_3009G004000 [Sorghum bicolor]
MHQHAACGSECMRTFHCLQCKNQVDEQYWHAESYLWSEPLLGIVLSSCLRHFSFLTATVVQPGNTSSKTQPNPPSPSFSENVFWLSSLFVQTRIP